MIRLAKMYMVILTFTLGIELENGAEDQKEKTYIKCHTKTRCGFLFFFIFFVIVIHDKGRWEVFTYGV